jgi:hypothetical protein
MEGILRSARPILRSGLGRLAAQIYSPIAWLPPGHDPGAGACLAPLPSSGGPSGLEKFGSSTRPPGRSQVTPKLRRPERIRQRRAHTDMNGTVMAVTAATEDRLAPRSN